jgi:hypothetical protein
MNKPMLAGRPSRFLPEKRRPQKGPGQKLASSPVNFRARHDNPMTATSTTSDKPAKCIVSKRPCFQGLSFTLQDLPFVKNTVSADKINCSSWS